MIDEIVTTGAVTFDPSRPHKCKLHIFRSGAGGVAFVEAIDTGAGKTIEQGEKFPTARYFGYWNDAEAEECLLRIMGKGSRWSKLPVL